MRITIPQTVLDSAQRAGSPRLTAIVPGHAAFRPEAPAAASAPVYEAALTLTAMGLHDAAIEALREVTARAPRHQDAWRKLAALLRMAGQDAAADAASASAAGITTGATSWPRPVDRRTPDQMETAEERLREMLGDAPAEAAMARLRDLLVDNARAVAAMRLLAHLEWEDRDEVTALALLDRALDLSPGYTAARADLARMLMDQRAFSRALAETATLVAQAPDNARMRAMRADSLACVGEFAAAIDIMEALLDENPSRPQFRFAYAQALHYVGRRDDSVREYRICLGQKPSMGEAYWGLADLKGNFLDSEDIASMRNLLAGDALEPNARVHMSYALGYTLERGGDYAGSFAAYAAGARVFGQAAAATGRAHDRVAFSQRVARLKAVFSADNLAAREMADAPRPACTPIFVVGMPRAGSTLVEQILASHPMVEGTRELPVMGDITRELMLRRTTVTPAAYPDCILELGPDERAALGARYIEQAGAYRKTHRPCFVDKRPWNWLEAGLIHLILPHARIIDIRRAPMAACFGMFKQILPIDAAFSYDLEDLGRYYNDYVGLMAHFQNVLPGRVHHIRYENLVDDTEAEIRGLLAYCGLPFDESCLRFWENDRAVSTPSAEQVRRPIFRSALEQWRHFEPWLGPLKAALAQPETA